MKKMTMLLLSILIGLSALVLSSSKTEAQVLTPTTFYKVEIKELVYPYTLLSTEYFKCSAAASAFIAYYNSPLTFPPLLRYAVANGPFAVTSRPINSVLNQDYDHLCVPL